MATLDVQKAFDVVNFDLLLRTLYLDGINGNDWLLVRDIFIYMTISWESHLSAPFVIRQGVYQGELCRSTIMITKDATTHI